MGQKFYCSVPNCSSTFTCRSSWRDHIKKVHKNFTPDEVQNWMNIISNTKPQYDVGPEQLGESSSKPRRGRKPKNLRSCNL